MHALLTQSAQMRTYANVSIIAVDIHVCHNVKNCAGSSGSDEESEDLLGSASQEFPQQHAEQDTYVPTAEDLAKDESETENDPAIYTPTKTPTTTVGRMGDCP